VKNYAAVIVGAVLGLSGAVSAHAAFILDIPDVQAPLSASAQTVHVPVKLIYTAADLPLNVDNFDLTISVTTPAGAQPLGYRGVTTIIPPTLVTPSPSPSQQANVPLFASAITLPGNGAPISGTSATIVDFQFEIPGSATPATYAINFQGTPTVGGDTDGTLATFNENVVSSFSGGSVSTPEPGSLSLIGLAAVFGLRRRRKTA